MASFGLYKFSEVMDDIILNLHLVCGPQTLSSIIDYVEGSPFALKCQPSKCKQRQKISTRYNELIEEKILVVKDFADGKKTVYNL